MEYIDKPQSKASTVAKKTAYSYLTTYRSYSVSYFLFLVVNYLFFSQRSKYDILTKIPVHCISSVCKRFVLISRKGTASTRSTWYSASWTSCWSWLAQRALQPMTYRRVTLTLCSAALYMPPKPKMGQTCSCFWNKHTYISNTKWFNVQNAVHQHHDN